MPAADAAGATVDEDDQDDEAVLVAERQKVSSVAKIMTRTWTSVMMTGGFFAKFMHQVNVLSALI